MPNPSLKRKVVGRSLCRENDSFRRCYNDKMCLQPDLGVLIHEVIYCLSVFWEKKFKQTSNGYMVGAGVYHSL